MKGRPVLRYIIGVPVVAAIYGFVFWLIYVCVTAGAYLLKSGDVISSISMGIIIGMLIIGVLIVTSMYVASMGYAIEHAADCVIGWWRKWW